MVKIRIDMEDPVLLEAMRLCGTDDPAVAVTDALKFAIVVRVRQAETRAEGRRELAGVTASVD
jgi:hypothetical protein